MTQSLIVIPATELSRRLEHAERGIFGIHGCVGVIDVSGTTLAAFVVLLRTVYEADACV